MHVVLMVEDHEMNRKLMRDILELDFEVLEAGDAEQALVVLQQRRPDLILMDLQLPGMDGITLTRQLQADPATNTIPVIAVSAHAMQSNIREAEEAGCVDYITKPITDEPDEVVRRLQAVLADTNESKGDE